MGVERSHIQLKKGKSGLALRRGASAKPFHDFISRAGAPRVTSQDCNEVGTSRSGKRRDEAFRDFNHAFN